MEKQPPIPVSGQCLCGAVKLTADASPHLGACHCGMCRRWGGGPLLAVHCEGEVTIEGDENVTRYNSSEWAQRGFCKQCGTHLFYHLMPVDDYVIPVGLLDESEGLNFHRQIFIDSKPGYYSFAEDTPVLTGEEVFAQFGQ